MKLYLGLKDDFESFDTNRQTIYRNGWRQLVKLRERGELTYPEHLNSLVIQLEGLDEVVWLEFTDQKSEALEQSHNLVQIDVPIEDIIEYFSLSIKNYTRRRKNFQIVYGISGKTLFKKLHEWKLFVTKLDS